MKRFGFKSSSVTLLQGYIEDLKSLGIGDNSVDVFSDRRIPEALANDPVLRGECLSGTLDVEDFRRSIAAIGWADFRYTSVRNLELNGEIEEKLGFATFSSRTVRAFKLADLENICEDYGQVAYYDGSIEGYPHFFNLDDHTSSFCQIHCVKTSLCG